MRKKNLLLGLAFAATSVWAQPPVGSISSFFELQPGFSFDLTFYGESGVRGCVGDFNNDGIDDFIVTGLHSLGDGDENRKSFFRVYLGERDGIPILAYSDDDFVVGGNGSVDCEKLSDGSWLVAIQGGANGNWSNPFKAYLYTLKATGKNVVLEENIDLDYGTGRASLRLLDVDMDGNFDVFQHGWIAAENWDATASIYLNIDETNTMFDMDRDIHSIRPANNTFAVKGDLNGDGKIDILLPVQGVGLFAYFNKGDGSFDEVLVTPFPAAEREDGANIRGEEDGSQADLIDIDGDGIPEIVLAGTIDNTGGNWNFFMKIYKYDTSTKTYSEIPSTDKAGNAATWFGGQRGDFAIADFDGDGKQDIIFGGEADQGGWKCRTYFCSGNGQGGFDQIDCTMPDEGGDGIAPMSRRAQFGQFLVGDFNGDGKPDLIQAGTTYYAKLPGVRFYKNITEGGNSVGENTFSNVTAYASEGKLYINGVESANITIWGISGISVLAKNDVQANQPLDLNLNAGIYLVEIATELGVVTKKIVIE